MNIPSAARLARLLALAALPAAAQEPEPYPLPEPPSADAIRYSAERFEYEGSTTGARSRMRLDGSVEVVESTWTLRAGSALLDLDAQTCSASGGFELDDGLSVLRGQSGVFDLARHQGSVEDVRAEYGAWRIWARAGTVDAARKAHFRRALFTSCNQSPPDYHFRASGVHVKPGKWLYATNARFHIGAFPVFYSPILWKSLDPDRLLRTRFSPAYDKRNGGSARSTTEIELHRAVAAKVFVDYYTETGLGTGGELLHREGEDRRGALYAYHIREKGTESRRWTLLGDAYQLVVTSWSIQGRAQAQSDPEVNNHYVRSNAFRVTPELINDGALVRQTGFSTTRIAYSRRDISAGSGRGFLLARESTPRLDFQTAPLPWRRLPALLTLNAFADNSWERSRGFSQRSAGSGLEAKRTLNLVRGVSLTPEASLREVFEDRRMAATTTGSSETLRDVFVGFYAGGANLRFDTPVGGWDARYRLERRLRPDSFSVDGGAPDYGIEQSLVTLQDTIRPNRAVLFRVASGYDFRRFRTQTAGFRERVQPITADISAFPGRGLQLSLRDDYSLDQGNRAFLAQLDWGERDASFAGFGVNHSRDRAGRYFAVTEGAWAPAESSWKLGAALRYQLSTPGGFDTRGFSVYEKEASIARVFHDFFTRVLVRLRPGGVQEVLFRVDLRTDRPLIRRKQRKDWEREWFPWRRGEVDDDRE